MACRFLIQKNIVVQIMNNFNKVSRIIGTFNNIQMRMYAKRISILKFRLNK